MPGDPKISKTDRIPIKVNHTLNEIDQISPSLRLKFQNRNNYISGMLMFIDTILATDPKFFSHINPSENDVVVWLQNVLLTSKCSTNVSLALTILYKINCTDLVDTFLSSFNVSTLPENSALTRRVVQLRLKNNSGNVLEYLKSDNQDVWEETYLFIKNSLNESLDVNLRSLQIMLWGYLENHVNIGKSSGVKICRIIELLNEVLEHTSLDNSVSENCVVLLQKILSSNYNNLKRYAAIIYSYFILNMDNLRNELVTLILTSLNKWATVVEALSNPKMSEDCRLCASKSLQVCFETVLEGIYDEWITCPLVKAGVNLLQDEDYSIRLKSSLIIRTNLHSKGTTINPLIILRIIIHRLVCLLENNFCYINLLWDLSLTDNQKYVKKNSKLSYNIFESTMDNSYSEPRAISELIYNEMEKRTSRGFIDVNREFTSKINDFIVHKTEVLRNLYNPLKSDIDKDKHLLHNHVCASKMAIIRYGIKFIKHLIIMFDLRVDVDFEEEIKWLTEIKGFVYYTVQHL